MQTPPPLRVLRSCRNIEYPGRATKESGMVSHSQVSDKKIQSGEETLANAVKSFSLALSEQILVYIVDQFEYPGFSFLFRSRLL